MTWLHPSDRPSWRKRTLDAGRRAADRDRAGGAEGTSGKTAGKSMAIAGQEVGLTARSLSVARLEERALVLSEIAETCLLYEKKNANLSAVRFLLQQRAREAWKHVPLDDDPAPGRVPGSSSSGAAGTNGKQSDAQPLRGSTPLESQRLTYLAASLSRAIDVLNEPPSRRVFGGAGRAMANYLGGLRAFALGHDVDDTAVRPESLKAQDPPTLKVVR